MEIFIDFLEIGDEEDLFAQFTEKAGHPATVDHPEALKRLIVDDLPKPLHLEFVNLSVDQLEIFEDLFLTLEDLEEQTEGFTFSYFLEQYEDEE